MIRRYLREELSMSYRGLGVVTNRFDDHVNLLKRQLAAAEYIRLLGAGREILNIDESIIRSTDHRKRGWVKYGKRILVSNAVRLPQISMIAAISSKGRVFFAVNQGKTTALTFGLFIVGLCQVLDEKDQNWRKEVTFLLDNAPYHRAVASFALYECLGIPTMFLAPYSFKMAAVEKLFSYVKNRDLNPLVARSYTR
jgi:hypothetical protein